jgi:hypothetical protein
MEWTRTDDLILELLWSDRFAMRTIAKILKRTLPACYSRRAKMGFTHTRNDVGLAMRRFRDHKKIRVA